MTSRWGAHLNHYLHGGGADFQENMEDVLKRDSGVCTAIISAMHGQPRGHTKIEQGDYSVQDFRYAFGAIDRMDFEMDRAAGLMHVWFKDRYKWHPVGFGYTAMDGDEQREPICVHAAAVEVKSSGAADYWMVGDGVVSLDVFRAPAGPGEGGSDKK